MSPLLSLIPQVIGLFRAAPIVGVAPAAVNKVMDALEDFVNQDDKARKLVEEHMQNARKHDVATFDDGDIAANRLRACVRPICTFVAMGWYVLARIYNIPLTAEDYTIIGGILAFWFGFRPFEKRR